MLPQVPVLSAQTCLAPHLGLRGLEDKFVHGPAAAHLGLSQSATQSWALVPLFLILKGFHFFSLVSLSLLS
jgi:hypothetical protein